MKLTEVNQKLEYAYVTMVMPDQDCSEKNGDKILLKEEIAHNNAKICYYGWYSDHFSWLRKVSFSVF